MGDEQTILLSPEEELTSVRERLEKTQARRIILVIPAQTQLRSHVGWRLIHARMRELNKELLVISPERQVRAVARAAGFQVAETQQEIPSNRPRLGGGTRPGATNTRGPSRSRVGASRGEPESQAPQRRRLTAHMTNKPSTRPSTPSRSDYKEDEETLSRLRMRPTEISQRPKSVPATFAEEPRESVARIYDLSNHATSIGPTSVEDDGTDLKHTSAEADYRTAQTIRNAAKEGLPTIEQAPRAKTKPSQFEEVEEEIPELVQTPKEVLKGEIEDLGEVESIDLPEIQPEQVFGLGDQPQREQQPRPRSGSGSTNLRHSPRAPRPSTQGFDDDDELLAIPDRPTQDIIDTVRPSRGINRGQRPSRALDSRTSSQRPSKAFDTRASNQRPSRTLDTRTNNQRPSQALDTRMSSQRPSQAFDTRTSSQRPSQAFDTRTSSQRPSQALDTRTNSQRPSQALDTRTSSQRPSQALDTRTSSQRPSQALDTRTSSQRPSQALDTRTSSQRPSQTPNPRAGERGSQADRPTPQGGINAGSQRPSQHGRAPTRPGVARGRQVPKKNQRGMTIFLIAVSLLIIVAVVLFYTVPSATVTISLEASLYTQQVHLNATTNPSAHVPNSVLAHTLTQTFSANDQEKATGTTQVGNAQAKGFVTFTNSGNADVTIPSNTVITTQSGIQFSTGAEVVVPHGGSQPFVPVTAQQQGNSGNVDVNTITVIPPASLSNIAQHSHLNPASVTANNLAVNNDAATSGGGAATVPAPTKGDAQVLTKALHQKIQQEVQSWLNTQIHTGDIRGVLVPDVLASANPLQEEQVSMTPPIGQPVNGNTFSGTLTLHVSVFVVRAADVQTAAGAALNTAALQLHPAKMLATQLPITLAHIQSTPSQDGNTLAISADATGEVIPQLNLNAIASSITSQGFNQAIHDLKNGIGVPNLTNVQDVRIQIFPSFLSILPIQAGHIHIILKPLQATPPPSLKNGS